MTLEIYYLNYDSRLHTYSRSDRNEQNQERLERLGFEYWSKRPFNKHGWNGPSFRGGKYGKKRTHKAERAQGKQQAKERI